MSTPCRVFVCLVVLALPAGGMPQAWAGEEEQEPAPAAIAPAAWLVLGPVDTRARRPFNPDAVFERYLLDPKSGVPYEGDVLKGERGEAQTWTKAVPDEKGRIGGRRIAYAYARLEMPAARVLIARLHGGGRLYVNGVGTVGDIYGTGFGGFPVALEKGANDLFVRGVRGAFKLTFEEPPAPVFVAPWSRSLPDLVAGEAVDTQAGVLVVNARTEPIGELLVTVEGNDLLERAPAPTAYHVPALGTLQVRLPLKSSAGKTVPADAKKITVSLTVSAAYTIPFQKTTLELGVREPQAALIRTFVSAIDDSVQVYGLRRPRPYSPDEKPRPMGLVLTLHGAGVNPRGQANAYGAKPDFWIVAPTNRRPFGFDWQDWGRQDAYEVLADALRLSRVDRSRVYLTGHSMGGHGAWHLAANDPDGFAAVAPSAGWVSFDSYAGGRPTGALSDLWKAADGASKTLDLIENLVQVPTFILHGEKDDNVPLSEARAMEKALKDAGAAFEMHVEPEKGHWWDGHPEPGAQCVDWPGIFDLFRTRTIPKQPDRIRFRGVDPGVDARHHWIEVLQPERYGVPFDVEAHYDADGDRVDIATTNVRALALHRAETPARVVVNGQPRKASAEGDRIRIHPSPHVEHGHPPALPRRKTPAFSGPFKRAFDRGFVFVYGTKGRPAENAALLERARFDAQMWCYRGNGQTRVLSDALYLGRRGMASLRDRNVILYGNADTNAAFAIIGLGCPLKARRGSLGLRAEQWVGADLAACFVYPQKDAQGSLVGVFADTGVAGTRLGYTHMAFVSGAGYPDYVVYDPRVLDKGDDGVLAAGWFDHDWRLQDGGYVQKEQGVKPAAPK